MAENRGGKQPSAPQNNFGISATGGAGSAQGQPATYMAGEQYGEGQDLYDLQTRAPMNKSGVNISPTMAPPQVNFGADAVPLDAPNENGEPITSGIDRGEGPGSSSRMSPTMLATQNNEDSAQLAALLPVYARIAELPNATNATRNFYRYLRSQAPTVPPTVGGQV